MMTEGNTCRTAMARDCRAPRCLRNPRTHVNPAPGLGRASICPGSRAGAAEERRYSESMTNGLKQSDPAIAPVKSANKGTEVPAEPMEGRAGTKGNPRGQSMRRTQGRDRMSQAAERIRQAATRKPKEKLTALLRHITTDVLEASCFILKKDAAAGVDGETWDEYGNGLEGRLLDLHDRVHSGACRALPSRRVEIPKPDGGTRPLGIAALEDKIVQTAVAETILAPIFEPEFLRACS